MRPLCNLTHRLADVSTGAGGVVHVEHDLKAGQIGLQLIVRQDPVDQLRHPFRDGLSLYVRVLHGLDHVARSVLEDCEHQTFSIAEIPLDNPPGDPPLSSDLVGTGPSVKAQFDYAIDGRLDHSITSIEVAVACGLLTALRAVCLGPLWLDRHCANSTCPLEA